MTTKEETKTVETWIKDLTTVLGVELALSSDGVCSFQVGDDTLITIEVSHDFPMVNICSPLVPLPVGNESASLLLMAKALELNAFQAITRGGSIAMPPGGGYLIFCYTTPIQGVDSETFSRILGGFFDAHLDLRKTLTLP